MAQIHFPIPKDFIAKKRERVDVAADGANSSGVLSGDKRSDLSALRTGTLASDFSKPTKRIRAGSPALSTTASLCCWYAHLAGANLMDTNLKGAKLDGAIIP